MRILFDDGRHKNVVYEDLCEGQMVQANQHLIVADGEALILDPGGHKIYTKLMGGMAVHASPSRLKHLFFSHQDPDIIAAANGWLMMTDAMAHLPAIWMRFLPHFGVDDLVLKRVRPIPDAGESLTLGSATLKLIPCHFLHSPGNFQVWDPVAKILYSGDMGASLGMPYADVPDFDAHIQYMDGFHRRYMPSNSVLRAWAKMARSLDPEIIAPQHGAAMRGKPIVGKFIDWIAQLPCGPDYIQNNFVVP